MTSTQTRLFSPALLLALMLTAGAVADDALPSWNDGPAKRAILHFVSRVTTAGSPDFVRAEDRLATFDNDGTLWCEQPNYVQALFLIDRVRALANEHPEWKTKQPYEALLKNDMKAAVSGGEQGIADIISATHAGMTTDQFERIVTDWLATARHPRFKRPFTACVYQPMLELLTHLRSQGFKTFIVSGGGIDFMRPWTDRVYGVPTQQVVGSSTKTKFLARHGGFVIERLPDVDFNDYGTGKPIGIQRFIGRRPIAAFGNSDGDLQMLQWTTAASGARLGLIVHHTDAQREYAYDRKSPIGTLDVALDQAPERGWVVVDMKSDWKTIFPPSAP
ncbi:MAG TPA: HAD family hydrolase [Pirellulales bacterium]|jgi:hypothetical protein